MLIKMMTTMTSTDSISNKPYNFRFTAPNLRNEWGNFIQMFQAHLEETESLNKPEAEKIEMLLTFLGPDAKLIFSEFTFNDESDVNCLQVVLEKFEAYCHLRGSVSERFAFWKLSQEAEEKIDVFVSKLRLKARTCGFGDQLEDLIRDKVVLGCSDQKLLEIFLREDDMTLENVLKIYREAESSKSKKNVISGHANSIALTGANSSCTSDNLHAVGGKQEMELHSYGENHVPNKYPSNAADLFEFTGSQSQIIEKLSAISVSENNNLEESAETRSHDICCTEISKNLQEKVGLKNSKHLGQNEQVLVQTEASNHKEKKASKDGLKKSSNVGWNFHEEKKELQNLERLVWYENHQRDLKALEKMGEWLKEGPVKLTIDNETTFCDPEILKGILNSKTIFDEVDEEDMREAINRSNPFELIRSAFFQNRSAMKMANMDAEFDFILTNPRRSFEGRNSSLVEEDELFSFADICGGSGGFSEYVLWKKSGFCQGFGITLKGEENFQLNDFNAGPLEMFEPYYGVKGDGDIYDVGNQLSFQEFIMNKTHNRGVHLVMADGAFSVAGQENIQEILSHRLYLCQFLMALMLLREGGNFVSNLFDLFTPFSVGLVYLMSCCFERIAIFKPVTSRPANSERFIICQGKIGNCDDIKEYLSQINKRMSEIYPGKQDSKQAILEVVPIQLLIENESFYKYVTDSNNKIGNLQIMSLMKIKTFVQNKRLSEKKSNQISIRKSCLEKWFVPDIDKKKLFSCARPPARFNWLIQSTFYDPISLDVGNMDHLIKVKRDFVVMPISSKKRYFLLGSGNGIVHRMLINNQMDRFWEPCNNVELPKDTILDVEFVDEQRREDGRTGWTFYRKRMTAIHVNDVLIWFGKDLSRSSFESRHHLISLLISSMAKEGRPDLLKYRVKNTCRLENIEEEFFQKIELEMDKGQNHIKSRLFPVSSTEERFVVPCGICLVKVINEPWMTAWNQSRQKEYFFHTLKRTSVFEVPEGAIANYSQCLKNSFLWFWSENNRQESLLQYLTNLDQQSPSK